MGQFVVLLQVAEPLLGRGDVVALVLRYVLFAGRLELLQVFVGDVFREVAEQRAVLRHDLERTSTKTQRKKGEIFSLRCCQTFQTGDRSEATELTENSLMLWKVSVCRQPTYFPDSRKENREEG